MPSDEAPGSTDDLGPPAGGPAAGRLDGNRVWRAGSPARPVLQKLYGERGGWLHAHLREFFTVLRGAKTGTRAAERRATEARVLALWRSHGCDAPAELSSEHPDLANDRTNVLEFVEGPLLDERLRDPALAEPARAALLAAFGAAWGRRHRLALELREPALLQEHATLQHVIVAGPPGAPRFVTFDHENAFVRADDVAAYLAKEVASVLPSLYRSQPRPPGARQATADKDARLAADLRALLVGYGDPAPLRAACAHYLQPRGMLWRAICRLDRAREERRGLRAGKFRLLALLETALSPSPPP